MVNLGYLLIANFTISKFVYLLFFRLLLFTIFVTSRQCEVFASNASTWSAA